MSPAPSRSRRGATLRAAMLVLPLSLLARPALAGAAYKWFDEAGDLHVTDRIDDVPEPYRSMYAAEEARARAAAEAAKKSPASAARKAAPAKPAPTARPVRSLHASSGTFAKLDAARAEWRGLLAHWRAELAAATDALARLDSDIAALRLNPLLRETPQVKAKMSDLEKQRPGAVGRVNQARKMLLEELPKRARREQVPPKWLQ